MRFTRPAFVLLFLVPAVVAAQQPANDEGQARTVIGPSNADLADGAAALRAAHERKTEHLANSGE